MRTPGIEKIYDILLENLARRYPETKITIQELKYIGDLMYRWMINNEEEIKEMKEKSIQYNQYTKTISTDIPHGVRNLSKRLKGLFR